MNKLKEGIESAWENRELLKSLEYREIITKCINCLNDGVMRVAEPDSEGKWKVNDWLKKAILLFFVISENKMINTGDISYYDKIEIRQDFEKANVRAVPPASVRHGAYIAPNVVLMPSFVNIGAYVDSGTMVDTWATVGSCAQIGKNVHLSGGVGIGGVLEPIQAQPVIVEDHCFIGSRCIIVEGAHIQHDAVLGANTVITASTHIIDVTGSEPKTYKGVVPAGSIVIPGTRERNFPSGKYMLPCALIIGHRSDTTNKKISLNEALRIIEN